MPDSVVYSCQIDKYDYKMVYIGKFPAYISKSLIPSRHFKASIYQSQIYNEQTHNNLHQGYELEFEAKLKLKKLEFFGDLKHEKILNSLWN